MAKLPHVVVTWRDACLRTVCVPLSSALKEARLAERTTTGFLIHDCTSGGCQCAEPVVVLAMTYDPPDSPSAEAEVDDLYTIPRQWVQSVRYLTRRPRRARVEAPTDGTSKN